LRTFWKSWVEKNISDFFIGGILFFYKIGGKTFCDVLENPRGVKISFYFIMKSYFCE